MDDPHALVGVLVPDELRAVFIAYDEGVFELGVGLAQGIKGVTADVACLGRNMR